jgi:OOP family OmpA-OmpF porin
MRNILLILLLLPLAGCAFGSFEQLKLLDPQADDFESSLAAEYLAFAKSESEQGRALSAEYFADKGMAAWRGDEVPPENVDAATPKPLKYELLATRELLMALLIDDVVAVAAQPAARAQLLFDCWVKQAGARAKGSRLCVEELQSELAKLEDVAVSLNYVSEEIKSLPFAQGSHTLNKNSLALIGKITSSLHKDTPYILELDGDTSNAHRARLFKARVAEIHKAFRQRGISDAHIRLHESVSEKTVYLSNDSTMKDSNIVTVTVRSFNSPPEEEK